MSNHTASAAGAAMPAEGRREPNPSKMADQIDIIKALVDAAYMAAGDLQDYHRDAMRGLLDETSDKIGAVQKEFTEVYCGGYVDDVSGAPDRPRDATPRAAGDPDREHRLELLHIVDDIDEVRNLVEAAWMAAEGLAENEDERALQALLTVTKRQLTSARDRLNVARGAPAEDRADV